MWMTESLKHLNLKQGRLLADGRGDATSSPDVSFSFSEIVLFRNSRQAGRQAAPTCCMDRSKDHRISLDRSNSFLHPSCPY